MKILDIKINLVAAFALCITTSIATVTASKYVFLIGANEPVPLTANSTSVLNCKNGVYSPVQKTCVSKKEFNIEMKRLFTALGIDASIYNQ